MWQRLTVTAMAVVMDPGSRSRCSLARDDSRTGCAHHHL